VPTADLFCPSQLQLRRRSSFYAAFTWLVITATNASGFSQTTPWPTYTVGTGGTIPSASAYPGYTVEVTNGANPTDCATGGGSLPVVCVAQNGAWVAVNGTPGAPFLPLPGVTLAVPLNGSSASFTGTVAAPIAVVNGTLEAVSSVL
jgi:hypothetical protein